MVQTSSPHNCTAYGGKRIISYCDIACLLCHISSVSHRKTHMSRLECGSIVRSVSRYCNNLIHVLKSFDKQLLIHRSCTRDDFQFHDALAEFFVAQLRQLGACDDCIFIVVFFPQAYLFCNGFGSYGSIACNHFDVYSGSYTFAHSTRHIGSHRVGNAYHSHKAQISFDKFSVCHNALLIFQNLIGKSKCSHGIALKFCEFCSYAFLLKALFKAATHLQNNLRSAL